MPDVETLKTKIRVSFSGAEYPGDWCLRGSNEGDEPFEVERAFKGRTDWQALAPDVIDVVPNALSFFSDEAFHFYLPAYLIADIDGGLKRADPVFHLTHGLDDPSRSERINTRRYGDRTWFDEKRHKFAMFTREEATAIVAYLKFKADTDPFESERINQALRNYWSEKAGEQAAGGNAE